MKTIVWKAYINYEKEEDWLNSMAAKGLAFKDFFLFRYVFEDCMPGEYTYRLELLNNHAAHPESKNYINFMAENGVEHISSWHRWVYFRKRSADGSFEIYSDIDSRIKHYQRIALLWFFIMIMLILAGISNIHTGIELGHIFGTNSPGMFNLVVGIIVLFLGVVILLTWNQLRLKIKKLRREQTLRE